MKNYLLALCLTAATAAAQLPSTVTQPGVSRELATVREQQLQDVRYDLFFSLPERKEAAVTGEVGISFSLRSPQPLVIDFRESADRVESVLLNGQPATCRIENEHLLVGQTGTRIGKNEVRIRFTAGNQSLNRNEEFMYTLLVPDRARTLFPCFDQPGLKARFRLQLEVPAHWKAVSNTYIKEETTPAAGRRLVRFGETEPLSTYLFSFVAGQLQQQTYDDGRHRFSAYYRETDPRKTGQLDTIFRQVAASLEWLENYTGIPYPFAKYDFIILPGFQYGGMEHTGATLYNDTRMFLSEHPTLDEELGRTQLIAHETAHMWFGDLLTMEWFDDVWTKEVFANHYAACISEPLFPSVNHRLNRLKTFYSASLSEDRTQGTTSIRQPLDNLNRAGLVYGQIIYNKAPVMMEKLIERMGEEPFQQGIRTYLKRYAYANATWDDLVSILDSIAPSAHLKQFSQAWVNEKGMPDIETHIDGQRIIVRQSDPYRRGILWPQRLALTVSDGTHSRQLTADLTQETDTLTTDIRPTLVLPNTDGRGYGRFLPDPASCQWLLENWSTLQDETARYASLMNLEENFLAHRISALQWCRSIADGLPHEQNPLIASTLTGYWTKALSETDGTERTAIETAIWEMSRSHPLPSCRLQLLRGLFSKATSAAVTDSLYTLWKEQQHPLLNERDYTTLAYELCLRFPDRHQDILAAQRARISDADRLRQFDFIARAVTPDPSEQDRLFDSLLQAENRRIEPWTASVLGYLNHPLRGERSVKYIRPALDILEEVQRTGDIFFPRNWTGALLGGHRSPAAYREVIRFLNDRPDYPPLLKNKILQAAYELFRANRPPAARQER